MTPTRHKQAKDENFPVGLLTGKRLRPLVAAYYKAARQADDIADNPALSPDAKTAELDAAEAAFYGNYPQSERYSAMFELGKIFQEQNLDARLYTDLLTAFRRDAVNQKVEIWEQLLDYCRYSAAPVGRFMLAVHGESLSARPPADTLCAVLQIVNHLQDIKYDILSAGRVYLPEQMMAQYGITANDLCLSSCTPALKRLIGEICTRLRKMLDDASVLPAIVRSFRLKAELGVIFSLTNSMLKKIEKGDVLASEIKLSRWDWLKALVTGTLKGLFCSIRFSGRKYE